MSPHSSLARLQQVVTVWVVTCAVAWASAWWSSRPLVAVWGAVAIAFAHAWIMAWEFLLLRSVRRGDVAPWASAGTLVRAWVAESWMAVKVFAWRQPFRWRRGPDRVRGERVWGRHGVVFVHGFVCNRGFWAPWRERLEGLGRAHVSVNLEPVFAPIDDYAALVDAAIRQVRQATGLPPVLVCHSMGGLVARAWLRSAAEAEPVAHVVTIASPHAGTWLARFSHLPNGRQMRQHSPWLQALEQAEARAGYGRFTCWWSNCDNVVMPPSTATLPGADNRFLAGAAHVQLAYEPEVVEGTLALIEAMDATAPGQGCSSG